MTWLFARCHRPGIPFVPENRRHSSRYPMKLRLPVRLVLSSRSYRITVAPDAACVLARSSYWATHQRTPPVAEIAGIVSIGDLVNADHLGAKGDHFATWSPISLGGGFFQPSGSISPECQHGIQTAESEGIAEREFDSLFTCDIGNHIQSAGRVRFGVVRRGR